MNTVHGALLIRPVLTVVLCLLLLFPAFPPCRAEENRCITRAVLLGVDAFAFRSGLSVAAENNVWHFSASLTNSLEAPAITIAFGKGSSSEDANVYQPAVKNEAALKSLLDYAFGGAKDTDVLLLYICTHGVYEEDGRSGLILSDGETDFLLTAETLAGLLSRYSGQKILILDACHSGAMISRGLPNESVSHPFGRDVSVLASSGALEESWYWTNGEESSQGSFYFTNQMCYGLNQSNGTPADDDGDGLVTLPELWHYLLENSGASTPALLQGKGEPALIHPTDSGGIWEPLRDIAFSAAYSTSHSLNVDMTVFRPLSLAYRVVSYRNGGWDFENALVFYDDNENYSLSGFAGGVTVGRKNRCFTFEGQESGYMLLQLITMEEGKLSSPASHVVALLGEACPVETLLSLTQEGELRLFIKHENPALFTLTLQYGDTCYRPFIRSASRPSPGGGTELITPLPEPGEACDITLRVDFANESQTYDLGTLSALYEG